MYGHLADSVRNLADVAQIASAPGRKNWYQQFLVGPSADDARYAPTYYAASFRAVNYSLEIARALSIAVNDRIAYWDMGYKPTFLRSRCELRCSVLIYGK